MIDLEENTPFKGRNFSEFAKKVAEMVSVTSEAYSTNVLKRIPVAEETPAGDCPPESDSIRPESR